MAQSDHAEPNNSALSLLADMAQSVRAELVNMARSILPEPVNGKSCLNCRCTYNTPTWGEICERCGADVVCLLPWMFWYLFLAIRFAR